MSPEDLIGWAVIAAVGLVGYLLGRAVGFNRGHAKVDELVDKLIAAQTHVERDHIDSQFGREQCSSLSTWRRCTLDKGHFGICVYSNQETEDARTPRDTP